MAGKTNDSLQFNIIRSALKPLHVQIRDRLLEMIRSDRFPVGSVLPPELDLARQCGVSRIVVRQAILDLVKDGHLHRVRGKGTFVSPPQPRHIGILMQTDGHVLWSLFTSLMRSLPKEVLGPFVIECPDAFLEGPRRAEVEQHLRRLVLSRPAAIVADGARFFPFELLSGVDRETRIIFLRRYEPPRPLPYPHSTVLPDYTHAGFIGMNHLFDLGHRKMLFLTPKLPDPVLWQCQYRVYAGCRQAIMGRGLRSESALSVLLYQEKTVEEELTAIFSSKRRPTAVLVYQDFYARVLYNIFSRLGLKVPDDVAVLGFYNTPWAEMVEVPLTSVSIRPDLIAGATAQLITDRDSHEQHILIPPELVIRHSCGAILRNKEGVRNMRATDGLKTEGGKTGRRVNGEG